MSAYSGWAVDDVFETHAQLVVIVAVVVEETEASAFQVKAFQSSVGAGPFDGCLVKRDVDLFSRFDVVQTVSVPE